MGLIADAFQAMPDKRLIVIGDGPEFNKVSRMAGDNISFCGYQSPDVLKGYMQRARAFVFAAEEDFGIAPVEAQACGTPVIAFGKGGVLETVKGLETDNPTGVFFAEQTVDSLTAAVKLFEQEGRQIKPEHCRANAIGFSADRFRREYQAFVTGAIGG
jgi:glycosyltransferase involved in cell wall biosynthesis